MKKSSWKQFFNNLIFICGAVALMAVASGASVGPIASNYLGTQAPEEKTDELAPQAIANCNDRNLLQQVLNFHRGNAKCKVHDFAKSETCPWTICRNASLGR